MTPVQQKQVTAIVIKGLLIHGLFLFGLSFGLNAIPQHALEWAIYHVITQDLHVITQSNVSQYPLVSVVTSVYAVGSGIVLFILFLVLLKHIDRKQTLSQLMRARFADQLKPVEDLKLKQVLIDGGLWFFGIILVIFHLFWLNDNDFSGKGGAYPAAFNSRLGIFIVQGIMSFWVLGMLILIMLWWLNLQSWYQKTFKLN